MGKLHVQQWDGKKETYAVWKDTVYHHFRKTVPKLYAPALNFGSIPTTPPRDSSLSFWGIATHPTPVSRSSILNPISNSNTPARPLPEPPVQRFRTTERATDAQLEAYL